MGCRDLRAWIAKLEAEGELKRVEAKVDWDQEIAQIIRKMYIQQGPALLFENIKDHENTRSTKLFTMFGNTLPHEPYAWPTQRYSCSRRCSDN